MRDYAIEGFTRDATWEVDREVVADLRARLEEQGVEVYAVGKDQIAGMDGVVVRFVAKATDDAEAQRRAHEILGATLPAGYGWGVSLIQPWRDGFWPRPFTD